MEAEDGRSGHVKAKQIASTPAQNDPIERDLQRLYFNLLWLTAYISIH